MVGTELDWMKRHPREVLRENGLHASKRRGQCFLISLATMERIVSTADLAARDTVLEIGTGLGRLTALLAAQSHHVVTVEVDGGLAQIASANLLALNNVTLLHCDFLAGKHSIDPAVARAVTDARAASQGAVRVVANLPYGISSPAIVNLLEWDIEVARMHVMVQKEVADRLTAQPGTTDYGPLTVFADYWAEVERVFSLPRGAFWPRPEVASALVELRRRADRRGDEGYQAFAQLVRRVFTSRRKTLSSALRPAWGRDRAQQAVEALGVPQTVRAEQLDTRQLELVAKTVGPPQD